MLRSPRECAAVTIVLVGVAICVPAPTQAACPCSPSPCMEVTEPAAGQIVTAGTSLTVSSCGNVPGARRLRLTLLESGAPVAELLDRSLSFSSWNSTDPVDVCQFVGDSTDYLIRAEALDAAGAPLISTTSAAFTIAGSTPTPALGGLTPDVGAAWPAGTYQLIAWQVEHPHGYAELWLYNGAQRERLIGQVDLAANGFRWEVPVGLPAGTNYRVRLRWMDVCGPPLEVYSSAFSVTGAAPPTTVTITSPAGGELWPGDSTQVITWTAVNPHGDVEVWLKDPNSLYEPLGVVPMSAGQFAWDVSPCIDPNATCKILLRATDGSAMAESNGYFQVSPPPAPLLTLVSPATGDDWAAGSMHPILWNSSLMTGELVLLVRRSGAVTVELGSVPLVQGSFDWSICPSIANGAYQIEARLVGCALSATSDLFSISGSQPRSVTFTSPTGGDVWPAGTPHTVSWASNNVTGLAQVFVPNDAQTGTGYAWVPVADGQFVWPIPGHLALPAYGNITISTVECSAAHPATTFTTSFAVQLPPSTALPGDLDGDGDVDLADLAGLQMCYTHGWPDVIGPPCDFFDFNPDGTVSLDDLLTLTDLLGSPAEVLP